MLAAAAAAAATSTQKPAGKSVSVFGSTREKRRECTQSVSQSVCPSEPGSLRVPLLVLTSLPKTNFFVRSFPAELENKDRCLCVCVWQRAKVLFYQYSLRSKLTRRRRRRRRSDPKRVIA